MNSWLNSDTFRPHNLSVGQNLWGDINLIFSFITPLVNQPPLAQGLVGF